MGYWVLCTEHEKVFEGSGVARHAVAHHSSSPQLLQDKVFVQLGYVSYRFPPPLTLAQQERALAKKAEEALGKRPLTIPEHGGYPFEDRCDRESGQWSQKDGVKYCILDYYVNRRKTPCIGWRDCQRAVYNPPHTYIVKHEELLMLTHGKYPEEFCPRTNLEEMSGVLVAKNDHAAIRIGRGWEAPRDGHKAFLSSHGRMWIDTNNSERMSMIGATAWCPSGAKVFVGGLGLGLVLLYIAKRRPREITVCEIDDAITDLVWPRVEEWFREHYPAVPITVVRGDAIEKVREGSRYGWVFMDLWDDAHHNDKTATLINRAESAAKQNLTETGRVTCWMKRSIVGRTRNSCERT